jgi:hypothetical protein
MKKTFSFAVFGLAGLIGNFVFTSTLNAAEPEVSLSKSATIADASAGTPIIRFETNFFDFGKTSASETLSGVFKFKNVGDGILKVAPPEPSCDCTDSKVTPATLAPGESGEIIYTIRLDHPLTGQRFIRVHSNDPKTPDVQLTMQLDHTPLYELSPKTLRVMLAPGKEEVQGNFTITRKDGKPLEIGRLTTSQAWISAAFDPAFKPQASSARINVTLHRPPGPPAPFTASILMWNGNENPRPAQTMFVTGEILGEVAAVPSRIDWVIPDFGTNKASYPAEALTQKIELTSVLGHEVELKNPTSDIKGLSVQIVPVTAGKTFKLVLKFDELPLVFSKGKVTVETSLASLPKLEVPLTISVPSAQ